MHSVKLRWDLWVDRELSAYKGYEAYHERNEKHTVLENVYDNVL